MDPKTKRQFHQSMTAAGASLADSTTRTSLLHSSGKLTIPANSLYIGKQFRVRAFGAMSNVVTTPGTLTLDLDLLNPTPAHVICATSQAIALNTTAKTASTWRLDWTLRCSAVGSGTSAKFIHAGSFASASVLGTAANAYDTTVSIPATTPADGTGFDSTVSQVLDLFATFSVSTSGTNIVCSNFSVESIG
jgi:hypothetical protein